MYINEIIEEIKKEATWVDYGVNPKSWTTNWRGFSYETDI